MLKEIKKSNVKFILISDERSGTNMVIRGLEQHPELRVWHEPFRHPQQNSLPKSLSLDELLSKIYTSVNGCAIHRTSHNPPNLPPNWVDVWKRLPKKYPNIRAINLYRENLLERYVSLQVAIAVGRWIDVKDRPKVLPKIKINPLDLVQDFSRMEYLISQRSEHFRNSKTFTYESFMNNYKDSMKTLQEYLGLTVIELEPATLKRESRSMEEAISNYDEVKERMLETKWAKFFL